MFERLFSHKTRMLLEELNHKHRLDIEAREAEFKRKEQVWKEDKNRDQEKMRQDHELKLKEATTLLRLSHEQELAQIRLDHEKRYNQRVSELNTEHYNKLSTAMTKLHEEGNVTTKFVQDIALKMFENSPTVKNTTKVLTGTVEKE